MMQTNVADSVDGLMNGTLTDADFQANTSPEQLQQTLAATQLPAGAVMDPSTPVPPPPPPPSSNAPTSSNDSNEVRININAF